MKTKQKVLRIFKRFTVLKWLFKTIIAHARGKWFIFRDAPLTVVRLVSSVEHNLHKYNDAEGFDLYVKAATNERITRKNNKNRA